MRPITCHTLLMPRPSAPSRSGPDKSWSVAGCSGAVTRKVYGAGFCNDWLPSDAHHGGNPLER
jgi:hypothetical protein